MVAYFFLVPMVAHRSRTLLPFLPLLLPRENHTADFTIVDASDMDNHHVIFAI